MELSYVLKILVTLLPIAMSLSVSSEKNTSDLKNAESYAQPSLDRQMCANRMDGFLFQDSQNCQAFIECQRQAPIRRVCSAGTLFNTDLYYCTAAHIVNCKNRPNPSRQSGSTNPSGQSGSPNRSNNDQRGSNNNFPSSLESHHSVSSRTEYFITETPFSFKI